MALQIDAPVQALVPIADRALAAPSDALPSIAAIRQRMAWMSEMRPVLLEYVQKHMDPARHMYSFANNRYTPLTLEALRAMLQQGQKPALNQDGLHNLMSLYACYPDEPSIQEVREAGFYTCRATLRLISLQTGLPMGAGTGSCSTRESKYAYRWVAKGRVPKGVELTSLKQRMLDGSRGEYTQYRLDNEDLADVEATVLQMAVKRAKSAAVKALPLVSELFAGVGDPDEEKHDEDATRQELLTPLGTWLRTLKPAVRAKALLAVFGEPLRLDDMAKLDEDRLAQAHQIVEIATQGGIVWASPTVTADLRAILKASAARATADLFGDDPRGSTPQPHSVLVVDTTTGEVSEDGGPPERPHEAARRQNRPSAPADPEVAWRRTLRAHQGTLESLQLATRDDPDTFERLEKLNEQIDVALSPLSTTTDSEGLNLAAATLEWVDRA